MNTQRKKLNSLLLAALFLCGSIWVILLCHTPNALNILSLKLMHPVSTSFMRYNAIVRPFQKIEYHWVSSKNISNYLKRAVVAAEDDLFFEHYGLDWHAINKAIAKNWKRKKFAVGASTISQQLVKNLYLSPSKDPYRKLREMVLAVFLDSYLSKERILELYLNIVEWGPNVYGAEAAAQYYFKTSAKNLGPEQAAFLASILPNPVKRGRGGFHMSGRASHILGRIR